MQHNNSSSSKQHISQRNVAALMKDIHTSTIQPITHDRQMLYGTVQYCHKTHSSRKLHSLLNSSYQCLQMEVQPRFSTFSDLEMDKKLLARVAICLPKKPIIMTMPATLYSINLFKNQEKLKDISLPYILCQNAWTKQTILNVFFRVIALAMGWKYNLVLQITTCK